MEKQVKKCMVWSFEMVSEFGVKSKGQHWDIEKLESDRKYYEGRGYKVSEIKGKEIKAKKNSYFILSNNQEVMWEKLY